MDSVKRDKIRRGCASLLDLRNYLFLRQSTLLFLLLKPCDVAERAVAFMLNTLQEIDILQVRSVLPVKTMLVTSLVVPVTAARGRHLVLDVPHLHRDPQDVREFHHQQADGPLLAAHGCAVGLRQEEGALPYNFSTVFIFLIKYSIAYV